MEISAIITCSVPKTPFSSCNSSLFNNGSRTILLNNNKKRTSCLVLNRNRSRKGLTVRSLFGLGVPELVVIAGVAALVFGPKKLPEVGKSIGKTVKSFQQAAKEFESELKKEPEPLTESSTEKTTTISEEKQNETKIPSTEESL
ncbi:hypothetical protein IFM89_002359 [Coptis chinensis]|uniref:Sec-independent protein translocase protein TATA, chloroplastic n=1 Tax=Coptis chinensis TaxID=261450 RepID=A0A835IK81_9MAGN|nr:hypothetical protein IFM89_002359 [Coptis chinensis]